MTATTKYEMAMLNMLDGPVWPDRCGHAKDSYVGSFLVHYQNGSSGAMVEEVIDMWVFLLPNRRRMSVCLRFGPEPGDYYSPDLLSVLQGSFEPYRSAKDILLHRGNIVWHHQPNPEEQR